MTYLHNFVFGVYPYIALSVFLLGSLIRFDREQYTWKSDSSQLLAKANMRLASNLFHVGILAIFAGHVAGLLTPHGVFIALGISDMAHQMMAIWVGTIFGVLCLIGGAMLWVRRMFNARVSAASHGSDKFILTWLLLTLLLGLLTIPFSLGHANAGDASVMVALADWVQSVIWLHPNPALLLEVDAIFQLHIFFGMTVFLVFPFTRMVHVWSGFGAVTYLFRPYQLVRSRRMRRY
jgi:nitrate reductase gamma subunit